MSENVNQFPNAIAPAVLARPKNEAGRFTLVTKSRGRSPRTRSRHRYLQEAGEGMAALMRGKLPRGLDWAAIYDMSKGGPADPTAPAILLCVFDRQRAAPRRSTAVGAALRAAPSFSPFPHVDGPLE